MASTSDFKKGFRIEIDGEPYQIVDTTTQTPSARGGSTLVKTRMRNMITGQLLSRNFKSGEHIKEPDIEKRSVQYLYDEGGDTYYFMDEITYEQFPLKRPDIEYELDFILPNTSVTAVFYDGRCIGLELPNTMELTVTRCDPAVRGDTVNNVTKAAELETGLEVQVPLFINEGEQLVIDTRDGRYVRRAK